MPKNLNKKDLLDAFLYERFSLEDVSEVVLNFVYKRRVQTVNVNSPHFLYWLRRYKWACS